MRSAGSVSPARWLSATPPAVTARTLCIAGRLTAVPSGTERIGGTSTNMASWQANGSVSSWRWRGSNLTVIGGDCTLPSVLVARLSGGVTTLRVVQAGYDSGVVASGSTSSVLGDGALALHAGNAAGNNPSSPRVALVLSWAQAHTDAEISAVVAAIRRVYPL